MPELHSFSLEGLQALVGTFAIPMMLLFESYRHGDWVLNTINKLLVIAPFLFYILLPIIFKKKTPLNFKNYFFSKLSLFLAFLYFKNHNFYLRLNQFL